MAAEMLSDDGPGDAQILWPVRDDEYAQERYVFESDTATREDRVHVLKSLSGLLGDIARSDHRSLSVQGTHPGEKQGLKTRSDD